MFISFCGNTVVYLDFVAVLAVDGSHLPRRRSPIHNAIRTQLPLTSFFLQMRRNPPECNSVFVIFGLDGCWLKSGHASLFEF